MRLLRLMPALERENDAAGRFTRRPCRKSQGRFHPSCVFSSVSDSLARPATPTRKSPGRTGAPPLFEALVRAWSGAGFHKPRTAVRDSPPFVKRWGSVSDGVAPDPSVLAGRPLSAVEGAADPQTRPASGFRLPPARSLAQSSMSRRRRRTGPGHLRLHRS